MAMMHPWLAVAVVVALLALMLGAFLAARPRPPAGETVPVAFVDRLRNLPQYRRLARSSLRWLIVQCCCLLVAGAGGALIAGRIIDPVASAAQKANRDIVLCLDVSGSMVSVDQQLLDVYLDLSERLSGERIGLMLFDSTAVTVFPLTDDPGWIRDQLLDTKRKLESESIPGTNLAPGSSLIGDGLASCVQRFDQRDRTRSRTVVFATDNELAGEPLYTLEQATGLAVDADIMVYGIAPKNTMPRQVTRFRNQVSRTHGDVVLLDPREGTDVGRIQRAIEAQEQVAMASRPTHQARDLTWPGAIVGLLGLGGYVAADGMRRRPWTR